MFLQNKNYYEESFQDHEFVCITSCKTEKEGKEEETEFLVTNPVKIDTTITKHCVCQIRSIQHIELRAKEKGYLEKIYVDGGKG